MYATSMRVEYKAALNAAYLRFAVHNEVQTRYLGLPR